MEDVKELVDGAYTLFNQECSTGLKPRLFLVHLPKRVNKGAEPLIVLMLL